jgi:tetratricopeptide (TPR) repeat protein
MIRDRRILLAIFISIILANGVLIHEAFAQNFLPTWIKNTAKWYGNDQISEQEFINAIQYLLNNNIIKITNPQQSALIPDPTDTKEELLDAGVDLLENQKNEQAITFFDEVLKKDPTHIGALVDKGIALARQGKVNDARQLFDFAIKTSEKTGTVDYRAVVNAGIILSVYDDPDEALAYFDRVINNSDKVRKDTLIAAYTNKGVVLFEKGKYQESIVYFDKVLEIEPTRLGAIINKANALQELKQYKEALKYFELAYQIDKDPLSWKPRYVIIK